MRENHHTRRIFVENHPIFKEDMYCFAIQNLNYSGYLSNEIELDLDNPISVYWTKEQLDNFRPKDTTFDFGKYIEKEVLGNWKRTQKQIMRSKYRSQKDKENAKYKLQLYDNYSIVFVQICTEKRNYTIPFSKFTATRL